MADLPQTLQDVLNGIIRERGGPEAFDTKALLAARGLVRLMATLNNGDTSKASGIAALEQMLPPKPSALLQPVKPLVVEFIESPSHSLHEQLRSRIRELEADLRAARMQTAPVIVTPAVPEAHQPAPQWRGEASGERTSNVVPLPLDPRGNGSAIVNGDLGERYPHLAHTPPVGRW